MTMSSLIGIIKKVAQYNIIGDDYNSDVINNKTIALWLNVIPRIHCLVMWF